MTKESNLHVTFSKRRSGLFKKASELCTLTGAEVALIVFSPGNKAFSFGHPSVEAVVDRFVSGRAQPQNNINNPIHQGLNMQLTHLLNQLEVERKNGDEFTKIGSERAKDFWWEKPTNEVNLAEMEKMSAALRDLKKTVAEQIEKVWMEEQGLGGGPYFMGAGPSIGGQAGMAVTPQLSPPLPSGGTFFMGPGSSGGQSGMAFPPHPSGGPSFMGAGPSGGGQVGMAFPPQTFRQPPPPEMNAAECGLSLFSSMEDID